MSEYPAGPLPGDFKASIQSIFREIGPGSMGPSTLMRRLETQYKIDFKPHREAVMVYTQEYMKTPEMLRAIAAANDHTSGSGGKGKKRERSPSPKKAGKKEKLEKKVKAEKKPADYPKGASSAYIIFAADFRENNKDMAITEQMKAAGVAWGKLTPEEKAPFDVKAVADKERAARELDSYVAAGGKIFKRSSKSKGKDAKKKKDPSAPKRGLSSYMFFAADFRTRNKDLAVKEQMRGAGAAWGQLSADDKAPFEVLAAADKERYIRECAAKGIKTTAASASAAGKDAASSSSDASSSDGSDSD